MLTCGRLKELLTYDPLTGIFMWREDMPHKSGPRRNGTRAGSVNNTGYYSIGIDGKYYKASRLAWLYMTGEWPSVDIDHRNRIRTDDRFENLREATQSQNSANKPAHRGKKIPFKGVYQEKSWGPGFYSVVTKNKKRYREGPFDTAEDAHQDYLTRAALMHGEFSCADKAA